MTNEPFARVKIDQLLSDTDWNLTDRLSVRFEYRLDDGGKADYALFDRQGRALAVLEAKSTSVNLSSGEAQGRRYADQLGVLFIFLSNGEEVWFCDKGQDAHFRKVETVFSQDDLIRRKAARELRWREVEKIEEKEAPNKESRITVLIVDSRPPFPELALYTLDAIPRPGDVINIAITGKLVGYKVVFVNFNPFNERNQITLGCSFSAPTIAANGEPIDLKERMGANSSVRKGSGISQCVDVGRVCWNFRCVDVFQRRADTKDNERCHIVGRSFPHPVCELGDFRHDTAGCRRSKISSLSGQITD